MNQTPKLSVIMPTYNEAGNIVDLIREIRSALPLGWNAEFVVVDDNSPDGTHARVEKAFRGDAMVKAILKTNERGLAPAIFTGLQHAAGEFVLVMDTDFTHRPCEIPRMLHVIQACDLASGSRFCSGGAMTSTRHYLASFLYNLVLRLILRTQVQDNLGGFWVARRATVMALDKELIFRGYGDYFFKLVKLLRLRGAAIIELPSVYAARRVGRSKSNFFRLLFTYTTSAVAFMGAIPKRSARQERQP